MTTTKKTTALRARRRRQSILRKVRMHLINDIEHKTGNIYLRDASPSYWFDVANHGPHEYTLDEVQKALTWGVRRKRLESYKTKGLRVYGLPHEAVRTLCDKVNRSNA